MGPSILLAAWAVQYRDIKYAITFIVQILMYAAPVVYPLSIIPDKLPDFCILSILWLV